MAEDPLFSLDGRVALITGASRGIGRALATGLGAAGATVVLNARDETRLAQVTAELSAAGVDAHHHACDVTDQDQVVTMIERIEADIGALDVLVNNAGAQDRAPFLDYPVDRFRGLLEVNLIAPFIVAQAVAAHMVGRKRGKIINVASVQAKLGRPTIAPYAATKGGLKLLTRGMCADLAPSGLQVNAIAPGYFVTEMTESLVADADFSAWVASRTPAGRWGEVDELVGATVFLASAASSFVNGQIIYVDGGMTAVV